MGSNLQSTLMRSGLIFALLLIFYKPIAGILVSIQNMIDRSNATNIKFQGLDIGLSHNKYYLQSFDQRYQIYKRNVQMGFQMPILTKYRDSLKRQLIAAKLDTNDQINILLTLLANARLCLLMLHIDKQLSKEQIELLAYLNGQSTPIKQATLLSFFKKGQAKYKAIHSDFDRFLNSLLTLNLITRNVSSYYTISDSGKTYLIFRIWSGYPVNFPIYSNKIASNIE